MKTTRKVISLFLALAMIASFVTIPALAATTETASGNATPASADGKTAAVPYTLDLSTYASTATENVTYAVESAKDAVDGDVNGASVTSEGMLTYTPAATEANGTVTIEATAVEDVSGNDVDVTVTITVTVGAVPADEEETTTYTVTFNGNGGSGSMSTLTEQTVIDTAPDCTFAAPDDKAFDYWAIGSATGTKATFPLTLDDDITLYAVWKDDSSGNPDTTDADKVAAVKAALTANALKPDAPASADYTEAEAKAAVLVKANALKGDTTLTATFTSFTAANAGTDGSIKITIGIKLNSTEDTIAELTVVIPAYKAGGGDEEPGTGTSMSALKGTLSVKTKDTDDKRAAASKVISDAAKYTLNMETEKLDVATGGGKDFEVAGFSVDGGAKWKTGAPSDKDIKSLFDKGGTLVLTNLLDSKKKIVEGKANSAKEGEDSNAVVGSILLTFSKIEKRAKDTKLTVNYLIYAAEGENGSWTLTSKNATAIKATDLDILQIVQPADNKKVGADDKYANFPTSYCVEVNDIGDNGKVAKSTYFIRTKPYENGGKYYPATKGYKVSVSSAIKAPAVKPDYKKEVIKPKAGMTINGVEYTKATAKSDPYDIADELDSGSSIEVYMAATAKKPRSAIMTVTLAPRASAPDASAIEVDASKGKAKLAKGFEVWDGAKKKWGGLPKISKTTDVEVRAKTSAKQGKEGPSGDAASESVTITLTWGVYDEEKNKSGIIEATLKNGGGDEPGTDTDTDKVSAVKASLTSVALKPDAPASADYTEATAKTAIEAKANALKGETTLTFTYGTFTAASGGTDGSLEVTVAIKLNDAEATTGKLTVVIPAYVTEETEPTEIDIEYVDTDAEGVTLTDEIGEALASKATTEGFSFKLALGDLLLCESESDDHSSDNTTYYTEIEVEYSTDNDSWNEVNPIDDVYTIDADMLAGATNKVYIRVTVSMCEDNHSAD